MFRATSAGGRPLYQRGDTPKIQTDRTACCNRAATGAGHTRTEQENDGPRNARNRLYERFSRRGSTYLESIDLTYKEEVAGSKPASPTLQKVAFCRKNVRCEKGPDEPLTLFDTSPQGSAIYTFLVP
jgi:hypothetical protein